MNSTSPARAPDVRTLMRQRPIAPPRSVHCFSTSRISGGQGTRKLNRFVPTDVRNSAKLFLSSKSKFAALSKMADALSRSSRSTNPSLNARTFRPTPPAVLSGGSPKRMMNSSLSCRSTASFPTTETTTLAETRESSLSIEKSSLLNRHFSSLFAECLTSRTASSSSAPATTATRYSTAFFIRLPGRAFQRISNLE